MQDNYNTLTLKECALRQEIKTDKLELGYIEHIYEEMFNPIRNKVQNLLEIGIYEGASLLLWKNYFHNAEILGIDTILPESWKIKEERITFMQGDAYSEETIKKLPLNFFDIIIDDGPHTNVSQIFFVQNYLKHLKPGGLMVLEDVIDTSITQGLIKLIELVDSKLYSVKCFNMAGKQKTDELFQMWKKGLDVIVVQKNDQ